MKKIKNHSPVSHKTKGQNRKLRASFVPFLFLKISVLFARFAMFHEPYKYKSPEFSGLKLYSAYTS